MAERHHKHIIIKWANNPTCIVLFLSPGGVWVETVNPPNWLDRVSYKLLDEDGEVICTSHMKKKGTRSSSRNNKFKIGW